MERCYHCDGDLSMLRVVVNKARYHYNLALEHAERGRFDEAIDELHNAIDLDRSFVPAHVVLGTIYAKKGDFEKARAAWESALAIHPELNKAHRYLDRLEKVSEALPVLRTMRLALTALLVTVVVLLIALFWQRQPDRAAILLKTAYSAYENGRYSEALEKLSEVVNKGEPQSASFVAAKALREALRLDLRQKLQLAQELKHREEYPQALALIAEIESQGPDPQTSAALAMLKQDINHYYRERILNLYNQYISGDVSYPELASRVNEFLQVYPDIPEKEELRKFLDDARELEVTQQMEAIRNRFRKDRDTTAAVEAMQKIAATYPGTEAMKKLRAELVDEILSWMFDEFQALLDQRNFDAARELLAQIRGRANEFRDILDVMGPVALAERVLEDNERAEQLRKLDRLVETGKFDDAEVLLTNLMFDDRLTTAELAVVMAAEERLEKKALKQKAEKLRSRKHAFVSLKISTDEATETLTLVENVLKQQFDLEPTLRVDLLTCAAAAAIKLSNETLAQRYISALEREKGTERTVAQLRKLLAPKSPASSPAKKK
ncbi:MAG: tetratricopeptide repeat protein [Candidatus Sumerlaeaceae bacterium]|nr:tetratricopeptide repeat protein [Candidatus Sumerlaeaceae bacterium]